MKPFYKELLPGKYADLTGEAACPMTDPSPTSPWRLPWGPSSQLTAGAWAPLAGDTIRSAADLKVPMVAVCLLHRRGYFYQRLDAYGNQQEEPVTWAIHDFLAELPERAAVDLEGRTIRLRAWRYEVRLPSCP